MIDKLASDSILTCGEDERGRGASKKLGFRRVHHINGVVADPAGWT
jgi:hypothetical protein